MSHIYPFEKDVIYFDKDLIRKYAGKRTTVTDRDIRDLLRVVLKYLTQEVSTTIDYKFDIPFVGVMHNKLNKEAKEINLYRENTKFFNMYAEYAYSDKDSLLNKKDFLDFKYLNKTREEIQEFQNEIADEEDN